MPRPVLLLPSNPLNERAVDPEFARDAAAVRWLDVGVALVDQDALGRDEPEVILRRVPEGAAAAVYRGWMLSGAGYRVLAETLADRGILLLTDPAGYERAHHLPGWLGVFEGLTPASAFVEPGAGSEVIAAAASGLGGDSFVVKDWVKSRKDEWSTACFASSTAALPGVVAEFLRLQGDYLVGDVVIREYVDLDKGLPEVRVWWVDGETVLIGPHPDDAGREIGTVPGGVLAEVGERVARLGCRFVTTDIARTTAGTGS